MLTHAGRDRPQHRAGHDRVLDGVAGGMVAEPGGERRLAAGAVALFIGQAAGDRRGEGQRGQARRHQHHLAGDELAALRICIEPWQQHADADRLGELADPTVVEAQRRRAVQREHRQAHESGEREPLASGHDLAAQRDRGGAQTEADAREQHCLRVQDRVGDRLRRADVGEHLPLDRVDADIEPVVEQHQVAQHRHREAEAHRRAAPRPCARGHDPEGLSHHHRHQQLGPARRLEGVQESAWQREEGRVHRA